MTNLKKYTSFYIIILLVSSFSLIGFKVIKAFRVSLPPQSTLQVEGKGRSQLSNYFGVPFETKKDDLNTKDLGQYNLQKKPIKDIKSGDNVENTHTPISSDSQRTIISSQPVVTEKTTPVQPPEVKQASPIVEVKATNPQPVQSIPKQGDNNDAAKELSPIIKESGIVETIIELNLEHELKSQQDPLPSSPVSEQILEKKEMKLHKDTSIEVKNPFAL